jgi:hypothetical protein
MPEDTAPATRYIDRPARPQHPVESTALRMRTLAARNGVTPRGALRAGHLSAEAPAVCHAAGGCPQQPRPGGAPRIGGRRAGLVQGKEGSQRQRATTQGVSLKGAWQSLPWKNVHRQVCRLPKRLDRATPRGDVRTVHPLQQLLARSWYARLLAVRRLPQDHRGRHPAGIDGVKSLPPPPRWRRAHALRLDGTARALRRIWSPTRGSTTAKRPLGMPTQAARARHTLVRQALAPEWEAKLSAHT